MRYVLALALVLSATVASAQNSRNSGMQNFTVTDSMTGHVHSGSVITSPNGSQSYIWTNPYNGETTTGFVSPPSGGTSTFSTFNSTTGQLGFGSINTFPPSNAPLFLPTPPSSGADGLSPYDSGK
jgi:hypothetical protein